MMPITFIGFPGDYTGPFSQLANLLYCLQLLCPYQEDIEFNFR